MTQANNKTAEKKPLRERLIDAHNLMIEAGIPKVETADKFAAWLNEHNNRVFWVVVQEDETGSPRGVIYFKKPGRNDINYAYTKKNEDAQDEMYLALADTICIGGAEDLLQDEQVKLTIVEVMKTLQYGASILVGGNL